MYVVPSRSMAQMTFRRRRARESIAWCLFGDDGGLLRIGFAFTPVELGGVVHGTAADKRMSWPWQVSRAISSADP